MKVNNCDEIERFKQQINFVEYAVDQGYKIDLRESSRNSKVLRDPAGNKIVIAKDRDGHGIYFNVHDDRDCGSIVDFVQRRKGLNLCQIRQELRSWIGEVNNRKPISVELSKLERSDSDRRKMLLAFSRTYIPKRHSYLQDQGCISAHVLSDARFVGTVRQDQRGNVVFPHYDMNGLCGYELKNKDFTGFSPGGVKGAWISTNLKRAKTVVIVAAAINALSHAQLTRSGKNTAYISIGGQLSRQQDHLIKEIMRRIHERGAEIIVATDNNDAGHKIAKHLKGLAPENAKIKRIIAKNAHGWNKALQERTKAFNEYKKQYKQR